MELVEQVKEMKEGGRGGRGERGKRSERSRRSEDDDQIDVDTMLQFLTNLLDRSYPRTEFGFEKTLNLRNSEAMCVYDL